MMPLTIVSSQGDKPSTSMATSSVGLRAKMDTQKRKALEATAARLYRDGNYTQITTEHLQPLGPPSTSDRYEGKTIVENKPFGGITVSSIYGNDGLPVTTPDVANKRAKQGAPTHGFFYHDTDFLFSAAKEYSVLEENEVFRHRSIHDVNFVRDTLDFFTNGDFTEADVALVQDQIEGVVRELAQQMKYGGSTDLTKLQSKLTIGGADVSISQVLGFQEIGRALEGAFDTVTVGQLQTQKYAQMGVAKAIGNYYGSDKGQVGEMFSSAITRLYDKGIATIKQTYASYAYRVKPWNDRQEDAMDVGLNIADTLSTLDTSSEENMKQDFAAKSSLIQQMVQNHCDRFNIKASHVGLAGDMIGLTKYFNLWMDRV